MAHLRTAPVGVVLAGVANLADVGGLGRMAAHPAPSTPKLLSALGEAATQAGWWERLHMETAAVVLSNEL
jgi:hypothetical protein